MFIEGLLLSGSMRQNCYMTVLLGEITPSSLRSDEHDRAKMGRQHPNIYIYFFKNKCNKVTAPTHHRCPHYVFLLFLVRCRVETSRTYGII